VDVRKIVVLDNQSLAVCTSFGVFIYSSELHNRHVFNPYELDPSLTPAKVVKMLEAKEYSSAVSGALRLNIPIRKLLKKIPTEFIRQAVSEIETDKLNILI
jgi:hypothetical protein